MTTGTADHTLSLVCDTETSWGGQSERRLGKCHRRAKQIEKNRISANSRRKVHIKISYVFSSAGNNIYTLRKV